MERGFLGVPWLGWGLLALGLAVVWVVVWPADQAADASGLRYLSLRWGHAVVWLLLAGSCFARGMNLATGAANLLALAALAVYLAFLAAVIAP